MGKRATKRLIIGFVYFVFLFLIIYGLYSIFRTEETCFDGIKNQKEEDVDCGGTCFKKCKKIEVANLIVKEVGVIESSVSGEYDFFGIISNTQNKFYGSENFDYQIKFKDESGAIIGEKNGSSFILPGDEKYVIENNIALSKLPAKTELVILNSNWVLFQDYYEKPDMKIINNTHNVISSGVGYYEAKGLLKNDSPYDFSLIKIKVILKDGYGKIIALNSTEMRTVKSGENRDFRAFWPGKFSGDVA